MRRLALRSLPAVCVLLLSVSLGGTESFAAAKEKPKTARPEARSSPKKKGKAKRRRARPRTAVRPEATIPAFPPRLPRWTHEFSVGYAQAELEENIPTARTRTNGFNEIPRFTWRSTYARRKEVPWKGDPVWGGAAEIFVGLPHFSLTDLSLNYRAGLEVIRASQGEALSLFAGADYERYGQATPDPVLSTATVPYLRERTNRVIWIKAGARLEGTPFGRYGQEVGLKLLKSVHGQSSTPGSASVSVSLWGVDGHLKYRFSPHFFVGAGGQWIQGTGSIELTRVQMDFSLGARL